MIARDEERVLKRCLESIEGIYDELVVVDTGSSDATPAIAERHGAKLLHFAEANGADGRIEDFSKARNAALNLASCDWILQIDADELLLSGHDAIRNVLKGEPAAAIAVRMLSGDSEWRSIRIFRRNAVRGYVSPIHEYAEIEGEMRIEPRIAIQNRPDKIGKETSYERNIRIARREIERGSGTSRIWHFLGSEHFRAREYREAGACFARALELGGFSLGRFHSSFYKAVCHFLERDVEAAVEEAQRSVEIGPHYPEAHCLLGDCHFFRDRFEEARGCYLEALRCKDLRPETFFPSQSWMEEAHPRKQLRLIDQILASDA